MLSIVDLGTVTGAGAAAAGRGRRAPTPTLARVLAARPARSLLLVAGRRRHRHARRGCTWPIAEGPGWEGGWLTSAGTGRDGYLQLVDLAPTVLAALGRAAPEKLFAGRTAPTVPGRPADAGRRDARARTTRTGGPAPSAASPRSFFTVLAAVQLLLFLLVVPLIVRARRHAGPTGPAPPPRVLVRAVEVLLIAAALAIPAALLADAAPWWRGERPGLVFAGADARADRGSARPRSGSRRATGARSGRWARSPRSAPWSIGADLLTGARLQLNGVAGYSAIEGARYAGVGSVGLGVFVAGLLLTAAGCLAQWVRRPWRPVVVVLLGGHRRGHGRQPVPGRRPGRRDRGDRRGVRGGGDQHRRLADLPALRLGGARRAGGDHRVRRARPAPARRSSRAAWAGS